MFQVFSILYNQENGLRKQHVNPHIPPKIWENTDVLNWNYSKVCIYQHERKPDIKIKVSHNLYEVCFTMHGIKIQSLYSSSENIYYGIYML